ncbi:hypothetical protein KPMX200_350015 [Klebsiella pneumoniae]|nr:hypothetical protein KPMX200_350015 [Klebsiella pneumoniae]
MVPANGLEPLPIRLQGDCSTIGAKPANLVEPDGIEPSPDTLQASARTIYARAP